MIELHSEEDNLPSAWERVAIARHTSRPTAVDYIAGLFDSFVWLHGDRNYADDGAMVGGIGMLGKTPVTVVGTEKGHSTKERIARNFGMPHPEGYRKALRLMQQAEKFRRPIVTFIDTAGAYPGLDSEERGIAQAIAQNLMEMSRLQVPIVSVVLGEGGSGGALGIGVCDSLLMMENAYYSVISPEGCATILWKDSQRAKEAASALRMTAPELYDYGIVDLIIPEPKGGAHHNPAQTIQALKGPLIHEVKKLSAMTPDALTTQRYDRIRRIGTVADFETTAKWQRGEIR